MKLGSWPWLAKALKGLATLAAIVGVLIAYFEYRDHVDRARKAEQLKALQIRETALNALGFSDQYGVPRFELVRGKSDADFSIPDTNLAEARRAIQKYEILQPQNEEEISALWFVYYLMAGDIEQLERIASLNSDVTSADLKVILGTVLATRFNLPEQADSVFEQAVLDVNANAGHLLHYARFLHSEGHHDLTGPKHAKAIGLLKEAILEAPNFLEARNALGHILSETGNPSEAIKVLGELTQDAPSYAPGHNTLGGVYWQNGGYSDAKKCFERALRLDPTNAKYLYNLSLALGSLGQSDLANERLLQATDLWKLPFTIESQNGQPIVSF